MSETIGGHDIKALKWALRAIAARPNQDVVALRFNLRNVSIAESDARNAATVAILDPAKLAAIIAAMMQECGWQVCDDDPGDDLRLPSAEMFLHNGSIGLHLYKTWADCQGEPPFTELDMPSARALMLAILESDRKPETVVRLMEAL